MNEIPTVFGKEFPCMSSISPVRILTENEMAAEFLKTSKLISSTNESLIKSCYVCLCLCIYYFDRKADGSWILEEFQKNFIIIPEWIDQVYCWLCSLTSSPHAGLLRLCLSNSYANFASATFILGYKGQLIWEANFLVLIWTKSRTKYFFDFCPKNLKWVK